MFYYKLKENIYFIGTLFSILLIISSVFIVVLFNSQFLFVVAIAVTSLSMIMLGYSTGYFKDRFEFFDPIVGKGKMIKQHMIKLLESANYNIHIVAGDLHRDFYSDERTINAMNNALRRGVKIEIICGPKYDKESKNIFSLNSPKGNKINLYQLSYYPKRHFMVIDNKDSRIEKFHELCLEKSNLSDGVNNKIVYDNKYLARELNKIFFELKSKAIGEQ